MAHSDQDEPNGEHPAELQWLPWRSDALRGMSLELDPSAMGPSEVACARESDAEEWPLKRFTRWRTWTFGAGWQATFRLPPPEELERLAKEHARLR